MLYPSWHCIAHHWNCHQANAAPLSYHKAAKSFLGGSRVYLQERMSHLTGGLSCLFWKTSIFSVQRHAKRNDILVLTVNTSNLSDCIESEWGPPRLLRCCHHIQGKAHTSHHPHHLSTAPSQPPTNSVANTFISSPRLIHPRHVLFGMIAANTKQIFPRTHAWIILPGRKRAQRSTLTNMIQGRGLPGIISIFPEFGF
jgi:hypothetical protein